MIGLLALVVRLFMLAVFTFGFVVLYEHGPTDYVANAQVEWQHFLDFTQAHDGSAAPAAPTPASSPTNS